MNRRIPVLAPLVLAGALLFASCGNRSSALDPNGPEASRVASLWWVMFGLAVVVYVVVAGFIIIATRRGRRDGARGARLSDDGFVWIGGIIIPAVILTVLGVLTVTTSNAIRQPSHRTLRIDVVGARWWWDVRYPDSGIETANEIHVPVGQPLELRLTSRDVIHSFWVPELAGKVDAVPGQRNVLRMRADHAGTYVGICAEYCGLQHAHMGITVVAESPGDFGRWVAHNRRPASEPSSELAARGEVIFQREACAGCHTIRGTPANGRRGPNLTHVSGRRTIGARAARNTQRNLDRWVRDPSTFKPGVLMPGHLLTPDERRAVIAYLRSLD